MNHNVNLDPLPSKCVIYYLNAPLNVLSSPFWPSHVCFTYDHYESANVPSSNFSLANPSP